MTQYTVMLNKYSKLMTVIYKTIVTQKKWFANIKIIKISTDFALCLLQE